MRIDYMHTDKHARRHKQRTRHGLGTRALYLMVSRRLLFLFFPPLITTIHIGEFRERHTCVHANWFVVCFSLQSAVRRIRMEWSRAKRRERKKHPVKYISILSECLYFQMCFIAIDRSLKKKNIRSYICSQFGVDCSAKIRTLPVLIRSAPLQPHIAELNV